MEMTTSSSISVKALVPWFRITNSFKSYSALNAPVQQPAKHPFSPRGQGPGYHGQTHLSALSAAFLESCGRQLAVRRLSVCVFHAASTRGSRVAASALEITGKLVAHGFMIVWMMGTSTCQKPFFGFVADHLPPAPTTTVYDAANQIVVNVSAAGRTTYTFDTNRNQQIVWEPSGNRRLRSGITMSRTGMESG